MRIVNKESENKNVLSVVTPLNVKKDVEFSDNVKSTILGTASSTVMGFFKLNSGDRTVKHTHSYTPIIYVDNNWYLEVSPAPMGKDKVATRLRVHTNKNGKPLKEEIIELPQLPKQKWMFIAILRDGRRFDVIYDNKIVASQRLHSYPVVISNSLTVGNKGLDGSVIHVIINNRRLSPDDIERERLIHVDTNNTVIESNPINGSLPALNLFAQCPSGLPCNTVTSPPGNLWEWNTPYA